MWADDKFIDQLCPNLTQNAAKVRRLRQMGLTVVEATNGHPKVLQSNVDRVFGGTEQALQTSGALGAKPPPKPDRARFKLLYGRKGA